MRKANPAINTAALYFTDRLRNSLAAMLTSPLILVEAPMGYGKTMAVRESLRRRGVRTVWAPVLGGGEDAFWRDFCQALGHSFPYHGEVVESLTRLGYPKDSVTLNAARELLLQLDFDRDTALVIDDIHLLPESETGGMARLCALLARQGETHLRMVLISRDSWKHGRDTWNHEPLETPLAVVGKDAFALTAPEIRQYYAACGVSLGREDAAALHKATGGWISALYLYLLRYSKDGVFSRPAAVSVLMEKEIFTLLPEQSRELLLRLSPLEQFTVGQAEFLLGGPHGAAESVLNDLRERNSFISHDEASGAFVLHSLFRHYLREQFTRLPRERQQAIHRRSADWFVSQKDVFAAIEASYRAEDYERALSLLESDMSRNLVTEKSHFFMELFKACPEDILDGHMGAAFKYAIAAFTAGNFQSFGEQVAWIGKKCAAKAVRDGENDPEARHWRGELEFLLSLAAYNDIAAMSAHHRRANELLGRPTKLFGPGSPWTLGCPSVLFMFHRESGKLEEELTLMDECLPHYYTLAGMHGAGGEYLMRAETLYNRGEFQEAAITCHTAEAMARSHGQTSCVLCGQFLRMRLALAEGRYAEAEKLLGAMRGAIRERRDFFLLHTVDLCEGYLRAFLRQAVDVPEWLRFSAGAENRLYTFAGGFYYIIHGRVLLLEQEYAALIGLFAWLLQAGPFAKNALFTLYAHIYTAAAETALGRMEAAKVSLQKALELALPDKLYMPFAENAAFLPFLRELGREEPFREGVARIFHLAAALEKARNGMTARHFPGSKPLLTKREQQLAQLALADMPYKDVAASLGLAPSTVKRAFASMYKKLGVSSRDQLKAYLSEQKPAGWK